MFEDVLRLLQDYEPTISSLVGLLTLCAAIWGVFRLTIRSRRDDNTPTRLPAVKEEQTARISWKSLFNLGLTEHSQLEELVSVRTVNVILVCVLVLSFPWLIVALLFVQSATMTLVNLVVFSCALLGFALQRAGATLAASWLVIFTVLIYWLGAMLLVGAMHGTEYFLAGLLALPVLILSRAQTGQRVISVALVLGVFVFGVSFTRAGYVAPIIDNTVLSVGYYLNAGFLALIVFASVSYYKSFASTSYQMLSSKKQVNEALVSKLIPSKIARQMFNEEAISAQWHPEGTVLVGTLTGFSDLYFRLPAIDLVAMLDELYTRFDEVTETHKLEKVKTLGTTYVAAAGLDDGADAYASVASCALAMRAIVEQFALEKDLPIGFRCAVATGLTISGVIGKSRPRFDIWGEALDVAAALEAAAGAGDIVTNETAYWRLEKQFDFASDGAVEIPYRLISERGRDEHAS